MNEIQIHVFVLNAAEMNRRIFFQNATLELECILALWEMGKFVSLGFT